MLKTVQITPNIVGPGAEAYRYVDTVIFTSSGTFSKASYPWLRALRVVAVGGGGAGGGSSELTVSGASGGSGGGSGGYAESFITDIAGLAASETVTVGAGGTGVSDATGNAGSTSSFGALVVASGGNGGPRLAAGTNVDTVSAGLGGLKSGCTGDFTAGGTGGGSVIRLSATRLLGGYGGASYFGGGPRTTATNSGGSAGDAPGAGASGTAYIYISTTLPAVAGQNGANGIVIVELFA